LNPNISLVIIYIYLYTKGEENLMRFELWDQLENKNCKIVINHVLFDEQTYNCDGVHIINDEDRIGVVIKDRELFMYKQDVVDFLLCDNSYTIRDEMTVLCVIVNKM
jgi:hypothetical protein